MGTKIRSSILVAGMLALVAPVARAEIAVMKNGKLLYVERFEREDDQVRLHLSGGGEVQCAFDLIDNIVANEVLPEPPATAVEPERPVAVTKLPLLPQLAPLVDKIAKQHGVDARLVTAVIWVESSGDPRARSRKGARGLMQLMPQTARELGVKKIYDPAQNVDGGVRYLKRLMTQYGDLPLALAAYNAGPTAVDRYRGIPPYAETERYVTKILDLYQSPMVEAQ